MEKIKWTEKVTNEVFERTEDNALLHTAIRRKTNWIGLILRRNCLLHDLIEG